MWNGLKKLTSLVVTTAVSAAVFAYVQKKVTDRMDNNKRQMSGSKSTTQSLAN